MKIPHRIDSLRSKFLKERISKRSEILSGIDSLMSKFLDEQVVLGCPLSVAGGAPMEMIIRARSDQALIITSLTPPDLIGLSNVLSTTKGPKKDGLANQRVSLTKPPPPPFITHKSTLHFLLYKSPKSKLALDFFVRRSTRFVSKLYFGRPITTMGTCHTSVAQKLSECNRVWKNEEALENVLLNFKSRLLGRMIIFSCFGSLVIEETVRKPFVALNLQ
ncbi:unnamed protein product [Dovyalis caffra]|uniref:Uncharacterized protein n=1 Tax=Dovyalis caffra TaxID=77055 RepID=A0AAV1R9C8_9ROSI|nr:unnamed protein product [Dovyalis caffra]